MKVEIDVLYSGSDTIIFESPLRGYPSLTLQGDTVGLLSAHARKLHLVLEKLQLDEEALESIEYIDSLFHHLNTRYKQFGSKP